MNNPESLLYSVKNLTNFQSQLLNDETITAIHFARHFFVLGTSKGSLFIVDLEGNTIIGQSQVHNSTILAIKSRGFEVFSACDEGNIMIWNWFRSKVDKFGNKLNCGISSLFIPRNWKTNQELYIGTMKGTIIRRKESLFSTSDREILRYSLETSGNTKNLRSDNYPSTSSFQENIVIRDLIFKPPNFLIFSVGKLVVVYSEKMGYVTKFDSFSNTNGHLQNKNKNSQQIQTIKKKKKTEKEKEHGKENKSEVNKDKKNIIQKKKEKKKKKTKQNKEEKNNFHPSKVNKKKTKEKRSFSPLSPKSFQDISNQPTLNDLKKNYPKSFEKSNKIENIDLSTIKNINLQNNTLDSDFSGNSVKSFSKISNSESKSESGIYSTVSNSDSETNSNSETATNSNSENELIINNKEKRKTNKKKEDKDLKMGLNLKKKLEKKTNISEFILTKKYLVVRVDSFLYFCSAAEWNKDGPKILKIYHSSIPILSIAIEEDLILLLIDDPQTKQRIKYVEIIVLKLTNNWELQIIDRCKVKRKLTSDIQNNNKNKIKKTNSNHKTNNKNENETEKSKMTNPKHNNRVGLFSFSKMIDTKSGPKRGFSTIVENEPNSTFKWVLCYPKELVLIRHLTIAETVLLLTKQCKFLKAIHLCEKYKRKKELIEIANIYAKFLWEKGEKKKAIFIWGDYTLPEANSEYWNTFAERLYQSGDLELLQFTLPFNNRNLLDIKYYDKILEIHLQKGSFKSFYNCIDTWPIMYSIKLITKLVKAKLKELGMHTNRIWSEKFKNKNKEYQKNNQGDDYNDDNQINNNGGGKNKILHLEEESQIKITLKIPKIGRKNKIEKKKKERNENDPYYLYRSLFKIYEFQTKYEKALKYLILAKEKRVYEYFEEKELWLWFRIQKNNITKKQIQAFKKIKQIQQENNNDNENENNDNRYKNNENRNEINGYNEKDFKMFKKISKPLLKKSKILVQLLKLEKEKIFEQLIVNFEKISMHDVVLLLTNHNILINEYLEKLAHFLKI
ncbi:vacuolar protein sorting-associated protein [Anaeramoeba flamelloides]|uniref:Vacuolar protein sorting-associated protein n=1 Tax=Anaeramoeba flamelloides TaxID=1746091 RepID=A0ABQ8YBV3_9EUKA|nr:vacuolar protein sorting-associated protein [Anaeramoeba flamelloides]